MVIQRFAITAAIEFAYKRASQDMLSCAYDAAIRADVEWEHSPLMWNKGRVLAVRVVAARINKYGV